MAACLFVLFPLMILTGLAMSPGMDAVLPVAARPVRRPADGAHHPFLAHGCCWSLFFIVHIADDPRRRADQRTALDHHRLVPHRSAERRTRTGGNDMAKFDISRRKFLTACAALACPASCLSGCDEFDGQLGIGDSCAASSKAPTA